MNNQFVLQFRYQSPGANQPRTAAELAVAAAAGRAGLNRSSFAIAMPRPYLRASGSADLRYSIAATGANNAGRRRERGERVGNGSRSLFPSTICLSRGGLLTHCR